MSADIGDALLRLCLGRGLGLRGEREDSCVLPFIEPRQQHDLAIGEIERVMIGVKRALVSSSDLKDVMFVDLGGLRAFKGSQRYSIPIGVNLKAYQSVIIWC